VVVVDGMLTVSDAARVRQAIDDSGLPVAGMVVTHPHPDHYAGLAHLVDPDDVAIVATSAVDAIIRRYFETFVDAVEAHADAIDHGDHSGVIEAMQRLLPTDSLQFLMDLSIEPTLATIR
jgi:glyoxylase-like metal-dependent hydrolase (beta-lactamase superfamily II)